MRSLANVIRVGARAFGYCVLAAVVVAIVCAAVGAIAALGGAYVAS